MRYHRLGVTYVTEGMFGFRYHQVGIIVTLRLKLAAALVLASLLAAPAVALASCWGAGNHAQHSCAPDCPMMAHADDMGAEVQAQSQGSTCCKISSDKTAPHSEMFVPTISSTVAPPAAHLLGSVVSSRTQAHASETASPPTIARSQSALCTFLI